MNELLKTSHRLPVGECTQHDRHEATGVTVSPTSTPTVQTYLKHLLDVVVLCLEQLAPGGEVAVGEDAARLQEPVSVTLKPNSNR